MKKLICIIALLTAGICAQAQFTAEFYKNQYLRQVASLGEAGLGVEAIIDKWEQAAPADRDMLMARFNYWLAKGKKETMITKDQARYLGNKPVLTLKDSLGRPVNYFPDTVFDDECFAKASSAIEAAIKTYPDELQFRFAKINALIDYEKESPDMAYAELLALVDRNHDSHPEWTFKGEKTDESDFVGAVQEYCSLLFTEGTPVTYEMFLAMSTKMSKLYPSYSDFISNIGSYWLVVKDNKKKASSYYKKALKLNPDDYAAKRNMEIIQSLQSRQGRSSK